MLLLAPAHFEALGFIGRALGGSGHVLLWAGLAWLFGRELPASRRGWPLWLGLAGFAGLAEVLQSYVVRTPEWSDWLYGTGGAALVCATWSRRGFLRWGGVIALAAIPLAWESGLQWGEVRAFPVLARPGSLWAARGWELNGVELDIEVGRGFVATPKPDGVPTAYPGFFRAPARRDWRGTQRLETAIFWPQADPATFAVRIDDKPGNPPYGDRFQREFIVTQGWNAVEIPVAELARTSGGRPLRLDEVRQWGVFLVSSVPFDYFCLGPVSLELQEERP
ncbi:MAG TPA: hypothetical protein P5204_08465 [Kiritimatiellia bacterium]|nr:hypothetical protein [Kiritimatiellia bacterium]